MRRGDVWTVASGRDYAGKARPVVILQDDSFDGTESITICAFTTDDTDAPLFRLPVEPNERNGLRIPCHLMVDKVTTVPKSKVGAHIGRLDDEDILRLFGVVGFSTFATESATSGDPYSITSWRDNSFGEISRPRLFFQSPGGCWRALPGLNAIVWLPLLSLNDPAVCRLQRPRSDSIHFDN
jgi:mRNA interferase MazF